MTAPTVKYRIVVDDLNARISGLSDLGVEICGAYRPIGHNYWLLYVTQLCVARTGVRVPHNACFWDDGTGRAIGDARSWVETIASLFMQAVGS